MRLLARPGLACPAQRPDLPAGVLEHGPEPPGRRSWLNQRAMPGGVGGCLGGHVPGGVPDDRRGQRQPGHGVDHAEQLGHRPQPVGRRQVPGRQRGRAHGHVPGGLVQAHRQAAAARPDQVDLHVHDHRRGQALVDAQANVRGDDPSPGRGPGEQERNRQADGPARRPAGCLRVYRAVSRPAGQVGQRLGDTERDDEAEHRHVTGQVEHPGADQAGGGTLQADHAADEHVDHHEQRELRPVRAQSQPHRPGVSGRPHGLYRACPPRPPAAQQPGGVPGHRQHPRPHSHDEPPCSWSGVLAILRRGGCTGIATGLRPESVGRAARAWTTRHRTPAAA